MAISRYHRTTLSDVAQYLGLSKSTVSRALNGYEDISQSTKLRVAQAVEQLEYRPFRNAQSIRTGLVRSIGLVLSVDAHQSHKPFLTDFLDGLSQRANEDDWTLTVSTAKGDEAALSVIKTLCREHKVDGFILPRTQIRDQRIAYLKEKSVPFVLYGRVTAEEAPDCAWFDFEGETAIFQAVARLYQLGHRRIAFVNGGKQYVYSQLRRQGFLDGLKKYHLNPDTAPIYEDALNSQDGFRIGQKILHQTDRPTAIICALDRVALGLYEACKSANYTIGSDISIISYDGIPEGEYADPPLTSFSIDSQQAGWRLADMLLRRLKGEAVTHLRETQPATLIMRRSDGPVMP